MLLFHLKVMDNRTVSKLNMKPVRHISVLFQTLPLLWTSAEQVVLNGPNKNAEMTKGIRMIRLDRWILRTTKNQRCSTICVIPAFTRWPPMENELRADCSSFLFSRMQAFNRLVDHVTQRLPLLVERVKPHTEHARLVHIRFFFSPMNSGSHFIAEKGTVMPQRRGALPQEPGARLCAVLSLFLSLKRVLYLDLQQ